MARKSRIPRGTRTDFLNMISKYGAREYIYLGESRRVVTEGEIFGSASGIRISNFTIFPILVLGYGCSRTDAAYLAFHREERNDDIGFKDFLPIVGTVL